MVDDITGAYLDHSSATPLRPAVRHAMVTVLGGDLGNPEALHDAARGAYEGVESARGDVARLLGASPDGVVFTAGDAEARNLAVKGIWSANRHRGAHIVTTAVEHDSVINACRALQRVGAELTVVPVDHEGRPDPTALAAAVRDDTVLVSVAHGQGEIGTVQDVVGICAAIRSRRDDVAIHVDCSTTAGILPIDADVWGCDAISIGGGSFGAPRWAGALWVRPGTRLHPLVDGGAQEGGKRAGHHDLPGIVGLGTGARIALQEMTARAAAMTVNATLLIDGLLDLDGVHLNGPRVDRIPGHVQVSVDGIEGEALTLMLAAAGVACSPGSACSAVGKSSAILEAIGQTAPRTMSAVLFTLSADTTRDEIRVAIDAVADAAGRLRAMGVRE
jgi:cysteine desulfurase